MALFTRMPKRKYEISDLYVMALSFILFYAVTRIVTRVVEKQRQKHKNYTKIPNPLGGATEHDGLRLMDDEEVGQAILFCIANDHSYLIKDEKTVRLIFNLVKEKIQNNSLSITPNLMQYLATRLLNHDQSLITKVGNIVLQSESRNRFFSRIISSAIAGTVTALGIPFAYGAFFSLLLFLNTENCFTPCDQYFERIPKERPLNFYKEVDYGHVFVANDDQQV